MFLVGIAYSSLLYAVSEIEISGLVSHEFTNYQIGEKLNISETTVKTHLRNIYSKTGIHDRATLAIRILNSDKT